MGKLLSGMSDENQAEPKKIPRFRLPKDVDIRARVIQSVSETIARQSRAGADIVFHTKTYWIEHFGILYYGWEVTGFLPEEERLFLDVGNNLFEEVVSFSSGISDAGYQSVFLIMDTVTKVSQVIKQVMPALKTEVTWDEMVKRTVKAP